jgi:hypothetical protein
MPHSIRQDDGARRAGFDRAPAAALQKDKAMPVNFGSPDGKGGIHKGGRPVGAKNKLQRDFLEALAKDFAEHGEGVIRIVRAEEPVKYFQIVASLMPRELAVEHNQLGDLSDDEVAALLEHVKEARAKLIEAKPEPRMISKRRTKAPPVAQDVRDVGVIVVGVPPDGR